MQRVLFLASSELSMARSDKTLTLKMKVLIIHLDHTSTYRRLQKRIVVSHPLLYFFTNLHNISYICLFIMEVIFPLFTNRSLRCVWQSSRFALNSLSHCAMSTEISEKIALWLFYPTATHSLFPFAVIIQCVIPLQNST